MTEPGRFLFRQGVGSGGIAIVRTGLEHRHAITPIVKRTDLAVRRYTLGVATLPQGIFPARTVWSLIAAMASLSRRPAWQIIGAWILARHGNGAGNCGRFISSRERKLNPIRRVKAVCWSVPPPGPVAPAR